MSAYKVAVLANLQQDSHFNLERRPGLAAALDELGFYASWHCIYALRDEARNRSIRSASNSLGLEIKTVDLILAHKECLEFLPLDFFGSLNHGTSVGFIGDEEWQMSHLANFLPMFKMVTVYPTVAVREYQKFGYHVLRLPLGCCFSKEIEVIENHDIDVIFVGRPYGTRSHMINTLIRQGIDVQVFGSEEWKGKVPAKNYKGRLSNDAYGRTVGRAKIVLGFMEAPDGGPVHINAKLFDAAKTGRFCLLTHYEPIYSDYGLVEGESIVTYRSVEDLCQKVRYYLDHQEVRERIASKSMTSLRASSNYFVNYRKLLEDVLHAAEAGDFENSRRSAAWKPLEAGATLAGDNILRSICEINCDAKMIVLNTEGARRVVVKRLPIVDASSVLLNPKFPPPISIAGLVWARSARRLPHFPLNRYDIPPPLLVRALLSIEIFISYLLERYRIRIRKVQPV